MGEVERGEQLGHSDNEVVKFKIFGVTRKTATKTSTLDLGREDFRLLRERVSVIHWETAFKDIEIQQCRSVFKYHILRAQNRKFQNVRSQSGGAEGQPD